MNTRICISVALAAGAALGALLSHALPPAQAQTAAQAQTPPPSVMDARVARLESRVDSLETEVNRLKANYAVIANPGVSPFISPLSPGQPVLPAPRQSNIPPSQITLLGKSTP